MGTLNVTPDSFSDGGKYADVAQAVAQAVKMLKDGADIIDIGGESTRPGAEFVPVDEETARVVPAVEKLRRLCPDCAISVDTRKPEVARAAINAGADIINDVSGLQYSDEMACVAAETGAGLILMHMRETPETMQKMDNLHYDNLLKDVNGFLGEAVQKAVKAGVRKKYIMLDPGIGFSKNLEQNLGILGNIAMFKEAGLPILVGPSRKTFIGKILGENDPEKRIWGTAGVAAWLSANNVDFIRAHDVKEIKQALTLFEACREARLRQET